MCSADNPMTQLVEKKITLQYLFFSCTLAFYSSVKEARPAELVMYVDKLELVCFSS